MPLQIDEHSGFFASFVDEELNALHLKSPLLGLHRNWIVDRHSIPHIRTASLVTVSNACVQPRELLARPLERFDTH